jgi:acyl-coenzyme A synthetase/AMP-(fatty) acid ligase
MSTPTFPDDFNLADYFLFERLNEGLGDKVALLFGDRRETYAEVAEHVRALRAFLAERGLRREERVLIVLHDTPAFAWAFFATLHQGAVVTMGNPEAPAQDLAYLVEYTRATVVITNPRAAAGITARPRRGQPARARSSSPRCRRVRTSRPTSPSPPSSPRSRSLAPVSLRDALARGRAAHEGASAAPHAPRRHRHLALHLRLHRQEQGGVHTHRDFAFNTEVYAKRTVGYRADDVTVSVPRLFFGYATGTNLMFPFAVGATAALFAERPTPESPGPRHRAHRPTHRHQRPHHDGQAARARRRAARAAASPRLDLSLRPLPPLRRRGPARGPADPLPERFGGEVYDGIGSAEMFHIYCSQPPRRGRARLPRPRRRGLHPEDPPLRGRAGPPASPSSPAARPA